MGNFGYIYTLYTFYSLLHFLCMYFFKAYAYVLFYFTIKLIDDGKLTILIAKMALTFAMLVLFLDELDGY